ncbi:hypothetical protein KSP40_PGU008837 [Platanthera guangdongensis]|uniref:tRNA(Ile)-lysidine synthetase n=1 Tax=Platanthera guangdongensis TaxID=2320717 RepID=A0ABR2N2C9_9ASPA
MALAGIKPHHNVASLAAIGVSGGPDSMALCVLTAGWKSDGLVGKGSSSGYIDGLLGIVVDHRLRPESAEEATIVQERVIKMGIRCEISCCNWSEGRPKLGNLQESARDMRYQIFQDVCVEKQIGVLLVAHHADDQAELFILRLSRGSGVCGLAGMAFVSQLFSHANSSWSGPINHGVLLVRPMLEFSKGDMYEICQGGNQMWVEDPTNQSTLFTRNCIRIALSNLPSSFRSEVQALVTTCRLTRLFVENICHQMLEHSASVMDQGYIIVDLEKLDPSNVDDLCLSNFLVMILQFISQRKRPVRGSAKRLLLEYIRNLPCKIATLTEREVYDYPVPISRGARARFSSEAGCYLSPAPRSKGTKIIVCYSPESSVSSKVFSANIYLDGHLSFGADQIIRDAKLQSDKLVAEVSNIFFLHTKSSETMLREALQLKLISQSTYASIRLLEIEERERFCSQNGGSEQVYDSGPQAKVSGPSNVQLYPGQSCHFMHRFLVTWKHNDMIDFDHKSEANENKDCRYCGITREHPLMIRHMVDADWLYLAKLTESEVPTYDRNELPTSNYAKSLAREAINNLRQIPAAARRALPVFVDNHNLPLCIPSIGFRCCPWLDIVAEFRPRVPLGGGYSSYL